MPSTYDGNGFSLALPEGWGDATVHVLEGPIEDGHAHSITIQTVQEVDADTLVAFADPLVETAERSLREAVLLVFDTIALDAAPPSPGAQQGRGRRQRGGPRSSRRRPRGERQRAEEEAPQARRAILRWHPESADGPRYQEQLFVLEGSTGYILTTSFTAQSRRSRGPEIEHLMRSFRPRTQ